MSVTKRNGVTSDDSSGRKGGNRGRARSLSRGKSRGQQITSTAPSGSAGEAGDARDAESPEELRRIELLRRLNQIERQRRELTRTTVVSFGAVSIPTLGEDGPHHSSGTARGVVSKRQRGALPVEGDTADTKRRRSDTAATSTRSAAQSTRATRQSVPPQHSPAISARAQTTAKPPTPALNLDSAKLAPLGPSRASARGQSGTPRAPASPALSGGPAVSSSAALNRFTSPGSPPASPSSGRGTGRVRTPSVLLTKQPGEGPPALPGTQGSGKNNQISYCLRIVKDLLRLKDSFAFSKPIDQLWPIDQLPGYFEMITHPMDLSTVQSKLESGAYLKDGAEGGASGASTQSPTHFDSEGFASDVRLVFDNARTYNRPGDMFFEAAGRLKEKFDDKFSKLPSINQVSSISSKKKKKKEAKQLASGGISKKDAKRRKPTNRARDVTDGSGRGGGGAGGGSGAGVTTVASPKGANGTKPKARRPNGGGNGTAGPSSRHGDSEISASPKDPTKMSRVEMEHRLDALKRQLAIADAPSPLPSPSPGAPSYIAHAQALYHVNMSFEEKVRLSQNVGQLSGDKLQKLVALVSKNTSTTMEVNNNEEIELDIDHMDNKTLRDMEAFVNQTLYKRRGAGGKGGSRHDDVPHLSRDQLGSEIEKLHDLLGISRTKESREGSKDAGSTSEKTSGQTGQKKQKSFYDDSDSSSDSDSSGSSSGSDSSSDDDSDDDSDSSDDDSDSREKQKRRQRNMEHMRQIAQQAGTPLPSPAYSGAQSSFRQPVNSSASPSPSPDRGAGVVADRSPSPTSP